MFMRSFGLSTFYSGSQVSLLPLTWSISLLLKDSRFGIVISSIYIYVFGSLHISIRNKMSTTTESSFERDEAACLEEKGLLSSQFKHKLRTGKRAQLSWLWISILVTSLSVNALWLVIVLFKPIDVAYENVISKYGI